MYSAAGTPTIRNLPFAPVTTRMFDPRIDTVASASDTRLVSVTTPSIAPAPPRGCAKATCAPAAITIMDRNSVAMRDAMSNEASVCAREAYIHIDRLVMPPDPLGGSRRALRRRHLLEPRF